MNRPTGTETAGARRPIEARRALAGASVAIGSMALVGWALDIALLKTVLPGLVVMKANSALAFVLAGLTLGAIPAAPRFSRWAFGLASAVAAIGLLTGFEYLGGGDLGIDQALFRESIPGLGSLGAGRMHPMTAVDFALLGGALMLLAAGRGHRLAHGMALIAGLIAGPALVGYLYGARIFVGLGAYNQMALHTAVGMLVISGGVLATRPALGLLRSIVGDGPGALMARRLLPAAFLIPPTLDGLAILSQRAGFFDDRFASAIRVTTAIALFVGLITWNARRLGRLDLQRIETEGRYRFLAEAMPQIVWTTGADGLVDYSNARWREYIGMDSGQPSTEAWLRIIHPDDLGRISDSWRRSTEAGLNFAEEVRLRRASDGSYRWHLSRGEPMRDEAGRVVRWVGTSTDIDDQKRVEVELRAVQVDLEGRVRERTSALERANASLHDEVAVRKLAEEAARSASRTKGEFLANMSHEIRTPMNGILGMTELTLGTELTPNQREYLGLVKSSADALLTIIDDILDFSKIEAGKLELDPVPFRPRDLVGDTLAALALKAHAKGLELAWRVDPEVARSLVGDPGRLRQVLINLVGNAIKFTGRGEVVVLVEPDPDPAPCPSEGGADHPPGPRVRFSVVDTGIGIPEEKRAAIFAPFEQADGSTTRRYGGTGLGLTISGRLVALMGGELRVLANPGPDGGSIFRFTAGFGADPGPALESEAGPALPAGLRVLVVDDNPTARSIAVEALGLWGCRPLGVAGAAEALAALVEASRGGDPFAAALIDRAMPGVDGAALAASIRLDRRSGAPKLLMLTDGGLDEPATPGVARSIPKPVRPAELRAALLGLFGEGPGRSSAAAPAGGPAACPGRPLRILLAEDHPVNQKVATRMLEDQGHSIVVVGDGRDAVAASASGGFDLALMDVQMPGMDGFEALAAIREGEAASGRPRLPIVAITAHAMAGDRERCLASGFDGYLSKPIAAARLRDALAEVAGPPAVAPRDRARDDEADRPARPPFDRRAALAMLGGDESLLDEVLGMFLEGCPGMVAEATSAAERGDHATLARLAHDMAGLAGNFAAADLVAAARAIERLAGARASSGLGTALADLRREAGRFLRAADPAMV